MDIDIREQFLYNALVIDPAEVDIRRLRWNDWNRAHIGRDGHNATPDEVEYVVFSARSIMQTAKQGRVLVLGPTRAARLLAAVLDPEGNGVWYRVSARGASPKERDLYRRERARRTP